MSRSNQSAGARNSIPSEPKQLTDKMNFGKYSEMTVEDLVTHDPQYLLWCVENIGWFDLDYTVLEEIDRIDNMYGLENIKTDREYQQGDNYHGTD